MQRNPNVFANNPLDRAALKRGEEAWLAERLAEPTTLIVPFWQLKPMVLAPADETKPTAIAWLRPSVMTDLAQDDASPIFLGLQNDVAHFAVDVSHLDDPQNDGPLKGLGSFEDLRALAPKLVPEDAAILAQGKSLIDWHARHPFCAVCGGTTVMDDGGYKRTCEVCGEEHFPRTDPVVIALVVKGDQCVLGRGPEWPENFYSAVAGYLEPGESIEEAVAREVHEEIGIGITKVRYHSTQPWPYPSSLMIGCIAETEQENLTVDSQELAEAKWVSRDDLKAILKGEGKGDMFVPPAMAIAHQLMKNWVFEGADGKPDYSAYDS